MRCDIEEHLTLTVNISGAHRYW